MPYKFISHPADTGIEIEAKDLPELFKLALQGFNATIFEKPEEVMLSEEKTLSVSGEDTKELLVNFLTEVLVLIDSERFVAKEIRFLEIPEEGRIWGSDSHNKQTLTIKVKLKGGKVDLEKMGFITEIKAITYHQLEVKEQNGGWFARVIFDI